MAKRCFLLSGKGSGVNPDTGMKTVAVTGASGFVGRNLVERLLKEEVRIRVLTRSPEKMEKDGCVDRIDVFVGDLTDAVADLHPFVDDLDVLFHCAGETKDPRKMHALHVDGTKRLTRLAAGRIGHWVQLSSVGAYGPCREGRISETSALNPVGCYETTKTAAETIVAEAAGHGAFSAAILRPSNIYGTDMTNQSLFQLIHAVCKGVFFFIGRPGAMANYIHIDNVVDAILRCADPRRAAGECYNISDQLSMEGFIALIADALQKPVPRLRLPETPMRFFARRLASLYPASPLTESRIDALTTRAVYESHRIRERLGYRPVVSMEEGIRQLVVHWLSRQRKAG
jgi:nucleoside-diphosphate-sugar epimerase